MRSSENVFGSFSLWYLSTTLSLVYFSWELPLYFFTIAILSSSFAEYLELCLADKGLEQIPGTENIPAIIQMKHVKAVWNSAVQLSDDFHEERLLATA